MNTTQTSEGSNALKLPNILQEFLCYLKNIKNKSDGTITEYMYDLRLFLKFYKKTKNAYMQEIDIEDIDIEDIDIRLIRRILLSDFYEYIAYLSDIRKNKANARSRKIASIKSFYKYLFKIKLIDAEVASIADELEMPKLEKRLPQHLNLSESKKLLSVICGEFATRDYAIITMFLSCGLRLNELINTNIDNIRDNTLTVIGKGNKERIIYLNFACMTALNAYILTRKDDDKALFISKRGNRICDKTVQFLVKKYIKLANLDENKYSVHKLRHTAATLMYEQNVDIRTLQALLGHASISTTEIYTHVNTKNLQNAVNNNPLANLVQ